MFNNQDEIRNDGIKLDENSSDDLSKGKAVEEMSDEDLEKSVKSDLSDSSSEDNPPEADKEDKKPATVAKEPAQDSSKQVDKFKDYPPLDEHPRFREIIREKKQLQESLESYKLSGKLDLKKFKYKEYEQRLNKELLAVQVLGQLKKV